MLSLREPPETFERPQIAGINRPQKNPAQRFLTPVPLVEFAITKVLPNTAVQTHIEPRRTS